MRQAVKSIDRREAPVAQPVRSASYGYLDRQGRVPDSVPWLRTGYPGFASWQIMRDAGQGAAHRNVPVFAQQERRGLDPGLTPSTKRGRS